MQINVVRRFCDACLRLPHCYLCMLWYWRANVIAITDMRYTYLRAICRSFAGSADRLPRIGVASSEQASVIKPLITGGGESANLDAPERKLKLNFLVELCSMEDVNFITHE